MTDIGAPSQHTIAGTVLTMPIRIRRAKQQMAVFSVAAASSQRMIDYSGLRVCRYRSGRALVVLVFVHFADGDLGAYHEYSTNVMVNPPGSDARGLQALRSAVTFVHHMPVDQSFTLEAGRTIWGYPKVMADFTVREGRQFGFDVTIGGQSAMSMDFRRGLPVPTVLTSRPQANPTYSHRDGIIRETVGETAFSGVRFRLGGVGLRLGDHPYARELAALGLPKRALFTQSSTNVEMAFGDAHEISS
jgi:Acetoacetate decarboxylase (ADC)